MAESAASPSGFTSSGRLDEAPPMPPAGKRKSLMDLASPAPDDSPGAGAASPEVQSLRGLKLMQMGAQLLASNLEVVKEPVLAFITQLSQIVPQALAQQASGGLATPPVTAPSAPPGPPSMVAGGPGGAATGGPM